jgi:hypothetical protein
MVSRTKHDREQRAANAAAYSQRVAARLPLGHRYQINQEDSMETNGNGVLKLNDARILTPAPTGVGAWAEKLRAAAFNAVKEADVTEIMAGLVKKAKEGDQAAAKLVLNYLTGGGAKVQPVVIIERGRKKAKKIEPDEQEK